MDLVAVIASIPDTFWGVVIGSFFTVLGVAITNASHMRRLRLQHEHERLLDDRTRDLTMRREVYLEAFEAIAAGMTVIGNFGELDIPFRDLMRTFMNKTGAIGKVTMVGREPTIQAVGAFEQALTRAFIRLSGQRNAVDQHYRRTRALAAKIERSVAEQERLDAAIESGDGADALRRSLEHERRRAEALRAEEAEAEAAFLPGLMQLIQTAMTEVGELNVLLAPVIREVRSELGLTFDEAFFVSMIEANHQQLMAHMQAFIAEVPGAEASSKAEGPATDG